MNFEEKTYLQCNFYVIRKKRLCRMTVKPGHEYCAEHEPQLKVQNQEIDKRIPCPFDAKHTCYASKLEKHLLICNSRPVPQPPYIIKNVNAFVDPEVPKKPLNEFPKEDILTLVEKINTLYDKHIDDNIECVVDQPIHKVLLEEFSSGGRTENSRRHLRQVSSLIHIMEDEGLVQNDTCYVELGAGKGHLSYYAHGAWCGPETSSSVVLVDRAALRHKRDNKLTGGATRVRADLAHLVLDKVPCITTRRSVVGMAKHLCGVATDYALRCLSGASKCEGVAVATCCHHRCTVGGAYVGTEHLRELGINAQEFNIMLGLVSWATCGDGRSREERKQMQNSESCSHEVIDIEKATFSQRSQERLSQEFKEEVGRRAKAIIDWARVLYLRENGFEAKLLYFVPQSVTLENVCIVAKKRYV